MSLTVNAWAIFAHPCGESDTWFILVLLTRVQTLPSLLLAPSGPRDSSCPLWTRVEVEVIDRDRDSLGLRLWVVDFFV